MGISCAQSQEEMAAAVGAGEPGRMPSAPEAALEQLLVPAAESALEPSQRSLTWAHGPGPCTAERRGTCLRF